MWQTSRWTLAIEINGYRIEYQRVGILGVCEICGTIGIVNNIETWDLMQMHEIFGVRIVDTDNARITLCGTCPSANSIMAIPGNGDFSIDPDVVGRWVWNHITREYRADGTFEQHFLLSNYNPPREFVISGSYKTNGDVIVHDFIKSENHTGGYVIEKYTQSGNTLIVSSLDGEFRHTREGTTPDPLPPSSVNNDVPQEQGFDDWAEEPAIAVTPEVPANNYDSVPSSIDQNIIGTWVADIDETMTFTFRADGTFLCLFS
jgi:hypothetical protein